jgi:hypothetical protein
MMQTDYVARIEEIRTACRILVGKPEEKHLTDFKYITLHTLMQYIQLLLKKLIRK